MFWLWFVFLVAFLVLCMKVYKQSYGTCKSSRHLVGKTVIVTGANSGVGYETAKDLADRGARVILACRSEQRGKIARDAIIAATGNDNVHYYNLDLSSFKSVREFADKVKTNEKRLDILINNAGGFEFDIKQTEDGILLGMQVNYLSPFLLTNLLLPMLKASVPSRIVNVASMAHQVAKVDFNNLTTSSEGDLSKIKIYAGAKLYTILMTQELPRRLKGTGVIANSLCPGLVHTEIFDKIKNPFLRISNIVNAYLFGRNTWEGAQTQIYLAVSPEVSDTSGCYFTDCKKTSPAKQARDPEVARKLWEVSEKLVKL